MKLEELLCEGDYDTVYVTKRSEIARAVASMSMAQLIDVYVEHLQQNDTRPYEERQEETDNECLAIQAIMKKYVGYKPKRFGGGLPAQFTGSKRLEKLKGCLDAIADLFDPHKKNVEWNWKASISDETELLS